MFCKKDAVKKYAFFKKKNAFFQLSLSDAELFH